MEYSRPSYSHMHMHMHITTFAEMCAELRALSNAQHSRVDLTKCSLYTTNLPCCMCTEAILQAGIRVVVYGEGDLDKQRNMMVYLAKGCFK